MIIAALLRGSGVYGITANGIDQIPWHSSFDLQHFRELTIGHTVIMGYKTWFSLPKKARPLIKRHNIVIVSGPFIDLGADVSVCYSLGEAIKLARTNQVFVIGGAKYWEEAVPLASEIYITWVDTEIDEMATDVKICEGLRFISQKHPEFSLLSVETHIEEQKERKLTLKFAHYVRTIIA